MRALLFVALAASFLATGVLGASQTSRGTDNCGLSQTWTMAPGETRKCCTASSLGSVTRFRYTVKPTSSTFNVKFNDDYDFKVTSGSGSWTPTTDATCSLRNDARRCTGGGCVKTTFTQSETGNRCNEDMSIQHEPQTDICFEATCNDAITNCDDARIEITFTHEDDSNALASAWDPDTARATCPNVCTNATRAYIGKCGALANEASDKWCPAQGALKTSTCCAKNEGECCKLNAGVVAGIAVGILIGVVVISVGICYCCKCCCFKYRKGPPAAVQYSNQPQVQMAPMGVQPPPQFGQPMQPQMYAQPAPGYGYPQVPQGYPQAPTQTSYA